MTFKKWSGFVRWEMVFLIFVIILLIALNVWGHDDHIEITELPIDCQKWSSPDYEYQCFMLVGSEGIFKWEIKHYGYRFRVSGQENEIGDVMARSYILPHEENVGYWEIIRISGFKKDRPAPKPDPQPKPQPKPTPPPPEPTPPTPQPKPTPPTPTPPEPTPTRKTPEPQSESPQEDKEDEPETEKGEAGTPPKMSAGNKDDETGNEGEITPVKTPTRETRTEPRTVVPSRREYTKGTGYYSVSLTVPSGLSIIHVPLAVEDVTHISDIFELLGYEASYLVAFENHEWVTYYNSYWLYDHDKDRTFSQNEAFIVMMVESVSLELVGKGLSTKLEINEGINLVGIPRKTNTLNLSDTTILAWANNEWLYGERPRVHVGQGFIILSSSSSSIHFESSPWGEPL